LQTYSVLSEVPSDIGKTAVTIGKFDCLHLGHQSLFSNLIAAAKDKSLVPTVVTFDRHPDHLLRPDRAKLPIIGKTQKHSIIESLGAAILVELEFNQALASKTPEQFVKEILVDTLHAQVVMVGQGFRFGNQGSGDTQSLRELGKQHGFSVLEVKPIEIDGETVSTTRVRSLLDEGNVAAVAKLLGKVHVAVGVVEHGLKIGRKIGFPTANLSREAEGYLPLDGVYSGWLISEGMRYPAAHSVGINETFQAVPRLVESHVLDETELDLYDKVVTLEFIDFVRPVEKFDGVDSLVAQINLDLEVVRQQLGIK
jgi:riboflavin kinase / FMN adenylyltransferase